MFGQSIEWLQWLNDSKWPWTLKGQMYLMFMLLATTQWVPNFIPFCSTASRFRVTAHSETSAPNYPKMTSSTKWSKAPHIHTSMTTTPPPNSQISTHFTLQLAIFELQRHFETSAPNDPKMTSKLKGQVTHIQWHVESQIPLTSSPSMIFSW